jgi:hypothetical protein
MHLCLGYNTRKDMRTTPGWILAVVAYAIGMLLIVRQHAWWYPHRTHPVAAAVSAEQETTVNPPVPANMSLVGAEVKELFALYQRTTYHLPRTARDFLLERLRAWADLSPDLQAETAAILRQLPHLDHHQALVYLQKYRATGMESKVSTLVAPVDLE